MHDEICVHIIVCIWTNRLHTPMNSNYCTSLYCTHVQIIHDYYSVCQSTFVLSQIILIRSANITFGEKQEQTNRQCRQTGTV